MITRQKEIMEILAAGGQASVAELSKRFEVSEVTIRSDLNQLARAKKIVRSHGGAQILDERVRLEQSFEARKRQNFEKKVKIGQAAAALVKPHQVLLLDSSSTVMMMALALRERKDLKDTTVIPTGIWTAMELMGCDDINVLIPGGYLRHTSGSITGLPSSEFFRGLNIEKAFLGAWGVSPEKGLTDSHLLEIALKRYVMQTAGEIIILADSSKFEQAGLASYANLNQISMLITDDGAPVNMLDAIRSNGVEVLVV